jgi:hypothetical protein
MLVPTVVVSGHGSNNCHMRTIFLIVIFVMISPIMSLFAMPPNLIYLYKNGPPTIIMGDFGYSPRVLNGFATIINEKKRPNGQAGLLSFLNEQLDESAHQVLQRYTTSSAKINDIYSDKALKELKTIADDTGIEAILVTNFNRIIRGPCIYEKERFRDVVLSPQTKNLLKQNPQGDDLIRLNWMLLADADLVPARNAIEAGGSISGIFKRKETISHIEIFPKKLSAAELQNIWVECSPTNRIALANVTEDKIRPDPDGLYYFYQFEGHKLVGFKVAAYDHGYPNYNETKTIRIGSLKNESSLKLPCSVEDFEKVFGKADEITRKFMW